MLKENDVYPLKQILKDIPDAEFVALHKNLVKVVNLKILDSVFDLFTFRFSYDQSAPTLYIYCFGVCMHVCFVDRASTSIGEDLYCKTP